MKLNKINKFSFIKIQNLIIKIEKLILIIIIEQYAIFKYNLKKVNNIYKVNIIMNNIVKVLHITDFHLRHSSRLYYINLAKKIKLMVLLKK